MGSTWELWDETNISPENGWLEDDSLPIGAKGLCSGASAVSFRASTKTVYINIQYIIDIYIYIYQKNTRNKSKKTPSLPP